MDRASPSSLRAGFALIIAACVTLAGLEVYSGWAYGPQLSQDRQALVHAGKTIGAAQALDEAVQDAERGQRGFLITGDPRYLEPYTTGSQAAPVLLANLEQLTVDDPDQRGQVAAIAKQLELKLAELARTVEVRRSQGFDAARQVVETDQGLESMHAIMAAIATMIEAERSKLAAGLAKAEGSQHTTTLVAWFAAAVSLVIVALGIFIVVRAVTGMRQSDTARHASEEHFSHLVNGVVEYAMYTLDAEGRLTSWNPGAERLKGYTESEILGRHFSVFFTEDDRAHGVPQHALEKAAGEGHYEAEAWHVRKDGSRFRASTLIDPLRDSSGRLIGFAKITRDVTERMHQQEALDRARAALAQSQKMDALGQLTGGIAHDFNNLLQVIRGSIEAIQRRTKDPNLLRFVDTASRGADRGASLTQQLLAFTRRLPLSPQPLDANKLVFGMSELLRRTLGENIAIETTLAGGLWRAVADVNQLESAIVNLAVNARDAMPDGGKLAIATANIFLDRAYADAQAEEVTPGHYVMIAVGDTGTGMSSETAAKAFEPFFTTKEIGKGTGLGLSQVYGFLKQSGGHIKIESALGAGTTLKMYLPRLAAEADADGSAESPPPPVEARGETILLVEDDPEVRMLTADQLRDLGYQVLVAGDAVAVRKLVPEVPIDLLFTDVGLPGGVNGRQLADEVCRRWPQIKVLFATGYARDAFPQHYLDAGIDLIRKPFSQQTMATKIRQVLDA